MSDFDINSLYGESPTRGDYQFAVDKAAQYQLTNEEVPMISEQGKLIPAMSGLDADTMMWSNPEFYGARAWGGAEDADTAQTRITMGMDENMQEVKYNIRWAGFQNSVKDIFANYELGDIETMALFDQIAGDATREEESVRLGGQEGAIFGEQATPGFGTGLVGVEQNIYAQIGSTAGSVTDAMGLYDNTLLGVAIRASGVDPGLAAQSSSLRVAATRDTLLPELLRAGKVQFGENSRMVQGAEAGDEEAMMKLYDALSEERFTLGERDMGYTAGITALPQAQEWFAEARELGLDLNASESEITSAFLARKTMDLGLNGAYTFINGATPEERAAGLAGVAAASRVYGHDFFTDSIAMVHERGFTPEKGWDKLDKTRREFLEANGITLDIFMNGNEGDEAHASVFNQATMIMLADREIMQIVGHKQRTRLIEREYGEGSWWGSTVRFGGDMYRGVVDDPMAMFDLTMGAPITGAAGALRFTSAKIAGAGFWRSSGRFLVENAIMEGTLAGASGLVSSMDAQLSNFQRGRTDVAFDSSLAAEDTAFTGAMGAGFSVALPLSATGVSAGVKKLGSGLGAAEQAASRVGMFGDEAKQRAEAYDIAKTLNNDELEFVLSHGSLPPEVAVRVQASSQAALDSANTFFSRHVVNDTPTEAADSAAAMLDAGELEAHGLSRVEVVNFLMAVATDLGKDGKIGKAELDTLWKGYLVQREQATLRVVDGDDVAVKPNTTVTRAERLQRAMAQRDAEAADHFVTSARVTNDPSPVRRQKAENIMARMMRGDDVTSTETADLLRVMTAVRDGRAIDSFQKFLIGNNLSKYMTEDQIGKVVQDLAEMKIAGRQAVEADPTLKRAIQLRAVMTNIANDLTTKSASGLGMTTRQIAKFIDSYISTAGNDVARAKLINDNPAGADVINKLWDEGSAKTLVVDEANASYDFAAFRRSESYQNIRTVSARRKSITAAYEGARNRFKRSGADRVEAFNKIRKQEEKLREDYKALGVEDYDSKAALDRMEAETKTYENLTPVERRMLMANALTRLVDRVDPELVSPTGASIDRVSLKHMFENTPLGDKLDRLFSRAAMFPQSQARLFRSNIRLIRAGAQFIGNQHIGRRRYGGRSDLSSIEGVSNAAAMESIAIRRQARDMATKLGPKVYNSFQAAVQQLRMRGLLVNDTPAARAGLAAAIAKQMPDMLKKYGGDSDAMLDDMFAMNNQLTDYFQRIFENAKRNGSMDSQGIDPRKYVPHNINESLSAEQRADFAEQMAALKQKQYEKEDSVLALDALVELGWLERETTKSEVVMDDPNVSVQEINYTVPENSPFRGISGKSVEEDAAYVVKNAQRGRAFLTELQDKILTPVAEAPAGKKRPKAVGDDPVRPGRNTETTAPAPRAEDRGTASTGDAVRPVARTAKEDGTIENALDAVYNSSPQIQAIEREMAAIAALDLEAMAPTEILRALERYENLAKDLEQRVGDALWEADVMLDRAGSGETDFRSDLTAEDITSAIMDKTLYDQISPAHKALRTNYDSYVAQGIITQDAADMALAMFADLPADKIVGITIRNVDTQAGEMGSEYRYALWKDAEDINRRLESGEMTEAEAQAYLDEIGVSMETGRYQGAMMPGKITQDDEGRILGDATVVLKRLMRNEPYLEANLIAHELSHALFQNAPRELKLAVQALYSRELKSVANGEVSPIMEMFRNLGIPEHKINYGMTSVHEFTSMIAEVALNRNRNEAFKGMTPAAQTFLGSVMAKLTEAMKNFVGIFMKDNKNIMAVARQTNGMSELEMRTIMDITYSMAHGRNAMARQARVMDEVFGLEYDRGRFDLNDMEHESNDFLFWKAPEDRATLAAGRLVDEMGDTSAYKTAAARGKQIKDDKQRA